MHHASSRFHKFLTGTALTCLLAACATAPAPPKPAYQGKSHYQRIPEPEGTARYQLKPGQSVRMPAPKRNPDPVYPAALVDLNLPPVTLVARLSVDAEGHVTAMWVSTFQGDAAHRQAFEDAVRTVTAHWLFSPLVFTTTVEGQGTPAATTKQAKPFSAWFRFQFKVVDGKPQTSSNSQPAHA